MGTGSDPSRSSVAAGEDNLSPPLGIRAGDLVVSRRPVGFEAEASHYARDRSRAKSHLGGAERPRRVRARFTNGDGPRTDTRLRAAVGAASPREKAPSVDARQRPGLAIGKVVVFVGGASSHIRRTAGQV